MLLVEVDRDIDIRGMPGETQRKNHRLTDRQLTCLVANGGCPDSQGRQRSARLSGSGSCWRVVAVSLCRNAAHVPSTRLNACEYVHSGAKSTISRRKTVCQALGCVLRRRPTNGTAPNRWHPLSWSRQFWTKLREAGRSMSHADQLKKIDHSYEETDCGMEGRGRVRSWKTSQTPSTAYRAPRDRVLQLVARTRVASTKCNLLSQTFVQPEDNLIPEQGSYVQVDQ